jgi:hypothetical protein
MNGLRDWKKRMKNCAERIRNSGEDWKLNLLPQLFQQLFHPLHLSQLGNLLLLVQNGALNCLSGDLLHLLNLMMVLT